MPSQGATSSFQVVKTTSASVSTIGKKIGMGNKPITSMGKILTLQIEQSSSIKLKKCLYVQMQHLHRDNSLSDQAYEIGRGLFCAGVFGCQPLLCAHSLLTSTIVQCKK